MVERAGSLGDELWALCELRELMRELRVTGQDGQLRGIDERVGSGTNEANVPEGAHEANAIEGVSEANVMEGASEMNITEVAFGVNILGAVNAQENANEAFVIGDAADANALEDVRDPTEDYVGHSIEGGNEDEAPAAAILPSLNSNSIQQSKRQLHIKAQRRSLMNQQREALDIEAAKLAEPNVTIERRAEASESLNVVELQSPPVDQQAAGLWYKGVDNLVLQMLGVEDSQQRVRVDGVRGVFVANGELVNDAPAYQCEDSPDHWLARDEDGKWCVSDVSPPNPPSGRRLWTNREEKIMRYEIDHELNL